MITFYNFFWKDFASKLWIADGSASCCYFWKWGGSGRWYFNLFFIIIHLLIDWFIDCTSFALFALFSSFVFYVYLICIFFCSSVFIFHCIFYLCLLFLWKCVYFPWSFNGIVIFELLFTNEQFLGQYSMKCLKWTELLIILFLS